MIAVEEAKDNVRVFLKEKVSEDIREASSNGKQEVRVYLDTDFELVEELLGDIRTRGYKVYLHGIKYTNGYALDISWK